MYQRKMVGWFMVFNATFNNISVISIRERKTNMKKKGSINNKSPYIA
jgi:hypothetical protein